MDKKQEKITEVSGEKVLTRSLGVGYEAPKSNGSKQTTIVESLKRKNVTFEQTKDRIGKSGDRKGKGGRDGGGVNQEKKDKMENGKVVVKNKAGSVSQEQVDLMCEKMMEMKEQMEYLLERKKEEEVLREDAECDELWSGIVGLEGVEKTGKGTNGLHKMDTRTGFLYSKIYNSQMPLKTKVQKKVKCLVVQDQYVPTKILIGRPFTDHDAVKYVKEGDSLTFTQVEVQEDRKMKASSGVNTAPASVSMIEMCAGSEDVTLPVMNVTASEQRIKKGSMLARGAIVELPVLTVAQARAPITMDDIDVDIKIPQEVKTDLLDVVNEYRDCVALIELSIGARPRTEHSSVFAMSSPVDRYCNRLARRNIPSYIQTPARADWRACCCREIRVRICVWCMLSVVAQVRPSDSITRVNWNYSRLFGRCQDCAPRRC
ncbi:unnamed protein product [Trichogramma brassicae]|uniref:Uncharacterized protein n=1 Tax=Trichogramma brassicae TaxID=86971 RepID=A0A6H5J1P3_9HYME|nr:unnamed protein product [Trichogramma brassicae]